MKLKKLLVFGLASVMTLAMSITAFGASLSTDEQSIITALTNAGVPAQYVTQAQNYLASNTTDVSAAQATAINAQITAAKTTAGSATTMAALTTDQKNAIATNLTTAGSQIGVTVKYDAAKASITATDATGATVLSASLDSVVKTTGVNMNTTIAIVAVLAMALAACGVVVSKRRTAENA